jgi:hypothetical protein
VDKKTDNPAKAKQARLLEERRSRRRGRVPDPEAPFTIPERTLNLKLPPFSMLACANCKAERQFDVEGRVLGPEVLSPCECGSAQFVLRRRTPSG